MQLIPIVIQPVARGIISEALGAPRASGGSKAIGGIVCGGQPHRAEFNLLAPTERVQLVDEAL